MRLSPSQGAFWGATLMGLAGAVIGWFLYEHWDDPTEGAGAPIPFGVAGSLTLGGIGTFGGAVVGFVVESLILLWKSRPSDDLS